MNEKTPNYKYKLANVLENEYVVESTGETVIESINSYGQGNFV